MNRETLQNIVGGLLTLLCALFGYLFSQADDDRRALKHEMDLHVSQSNQRLDQIEGELNDLWAKYNDMIRTEKQTEHRLTKLESK